VKKTGSLRNFLIEVSFLSNFQKLVFSFKRRKNGLAILKSEILEISLLGGLLASFLLKFEVLFCEKSKK